LEWGKTYYWRVDAVGEADPASVWAGRVWSFAIADCIIPLKPVDGALEFAGSPIILSWESRGIGMQYDIYLGEDKDAVAGATVDSAGIYRGRQPSLATTYDPGAVAGGTKHYWRIDAVDETDPRSPWKGDVWSFSTVDESVVQVAIVDDFEGYTNAIGERVFEKWIDGLGFTLPEPGHPGNGTGAMIGHDIWSADSLYYGGQIMEVADAHSGQAMPLYYDTGWAPCCSEAERTWDTPQDWTVDEADMLTLCFRGTPGNSPDRFYVAVEDSAGRIAVVAHPDAGALLVTEWQRWLVPFADFAGLGVDMASVKKLIIGIGDRDNPYPGGYGIIYIDDITLANGMP